MPHAISLFDAAILGMVEGLTEFLPVSSTGHLILFAHWLGLDGESAGVKAFEIVIQAGALLAVVGLYLRSVRSMVLGLLGRDRAGLVLVWQLFVAFLPAAVLGLTAGDWIKANLFGVKPVVIALAWGGVLMIVIERWRAGRLRAQNAAGAARVGEGSVPAAAAEGASAPNKASVTEGYSLAAMTWKTALLIGLFQCMAMWPGTSRSMMTIVAALILGFSPRAAAEFSFLLALPTLGAATLYDLLHQGPALLQASGALGLALGFGVSCLVAWLAVKGFLAYLTRHGMAVFGWYRLALALVVTVVLLI